MNTNCDYFYFGDFIFSPKKKAVNLLELNHKNRKKSKMTFLGQKKTHFSQNLEFQIYFIPICICMCDRISKFSFIFIQSYWYIFGMQVENYFVYLHKNKQKKFKWTKTEFDLSMRNFTNAVLIKSYLIFIFYQFKYRSDTWA